MDDTGHPAMTPDASLPATVRHAVNVFACESLHVCTVCIWLCEHARFCVDFFFKHYILYIL